VRLSLVDRGLTFGSTVARGVCLRFREPARRRRSRLRGEDTTGM
jgi:hypothetical protein